MGRAPVTWATDPVETAASYERVSRQVQAIYGRGLRRTERSVDDMAQDLGLTLPAELRFRDGVDEDAGGARWDLPQLERVVELARAGRFKTLLVPTTDRWTRDTPKGLAFTRQVRDYGVRVVWGDLPDVPDPGDGNPYATHWRQKMESEAFMDAEFERARIRWRTMHGRRDKADEGRVPGSGRPPYGFRYVRDETPKHAVCGLEVYEPEARVVRELYARALVGSLATLLVWLQAEAIPPPGATLTFRKAWYTASAGRHWEGHSVHRILTDRVYTGTYTWGGREFPVTPIVTTDTFELVAEAMAARRGRRGAARIKAEDDPYLFRGRLECGPCTEREGRAVIFQTKIANQANNRYYVCSRSLSEADRGSLRAPVGRERCSVPRVRADLIEAQAWAALVEVLSDPDRLRAELEAARERRRLDDRGRDDRRRAVEGEIASCERRLRVHVKRLTELEAEGDDMAKEEAAIHTAERDDAKALLVRLRRELREVEAAPGAGLSSAEVDELQRLAGDVQLVAEHATAADRRRIIGLANLRAVVGSDGEQVMVQTRPQRTVAIRWSGTVQVSVAQTSDSNCLPCFLKYDLQVLSPRLAFVA
jgi:site-specific DNA recombinase